MHTVLYVEDERAIAKGVIGGLEAEGFTALWAQSAEEGLSMLRANKVHLILLDVRLPGMDGFAFCRAIRQGGDSTPVIMVTARDEEVDRVLGLEIGADDYLVKPFSLRELVARVRSQIRRSYGELSPASARVILAGPLQINRSSLEVQRNGSAISLTPIEFKLLVCLVENANTTMTRRVLIDRIWGPEYVLEDERTVDVHVRHLRTKIEDDPEHPQIITTVRGYGYRFVNNSS